MLPLVRVIIYVSTFPLVREGTKGLETETEKEPTTKPRKALGCGKCIKRKKDFHFLQMKVFSVKSNQHATVATGTLHFFDNLSLRRKIPSNYIMQFDELFLGHWNFKPNCIIM